jgi:hypothetical protein
MKRYERGEVLVFVGRKDGSRMEEHFENFELGKSYEISDVKVVSYDIDEVTNMSSRCILFYNEKYGCHEESAPLYFVTKDEYREMQVNKVISKR